VAFGIAWLVALGHLPASATCPPLAAAVATGDPFGDQTAIARHTAREGRLSGRRLQELFRAGEIKTPALALYPTTGAAPLEVRAQWLWMPVDEPALIEFDADEGGPPDASTASYTSWRHTYQQPGTFRPRVTVRDRSGRSWSATMSVVVSTVAALDAELQRRWTSFKQALDRRDLTAALECVHSGVRDRHREILAAVFGHVTPPPADDVLTTLQLVRTLGPFVIYEMARPEKATGETFSFEVRFAIDVDGVWRLQSL
jgi:hypothetical protein